MRVLRFAPVILLAGVLALAFGLAFSRALTRHASGAVVWSQQIGDGEVFPACGSAFANQTTCTGSSAQATIMWSVQGYHDPHGPSHISPCDSVDIYLNGSLATNQPCNGAYTFSGLTANQHYSCLVRAAQNTGAGIGESAESYDCSFTTPACAAPQPTQTLCPDGSAAPNGSASQCTCAQGNAAACTPSSSQGPMVVTCVGSPSTVAPGRPVTWGSQVQGGVYPYHFIWSDSRGNNGDTGNTSNWGPFNYVLQGQVQGNVLVVDSSGAQQSASCYVNVTNNPSAPTPQQPGQNPGASQNPGGPGGGGGTGGSGGTGGGGNTTFPTCSPPATGYGCQICPSTTSASPGQPVQMVWNSSCDTANDNCTVLNKFGFSVVITAGGTDFEPGVGGVSPNTSNQPITVVPSSLPATYTLTGYMQYVIAGIQTSIKVPGSDYMCSVTINAAQAICPDGSKAPGGNVAACNTSCALRSITCTPNASALQYNYFGCAAKTQACQYFAQGYGCVNAASGAYCKTPPKPSGSLTVVPTLVKPGTPVQLSWQVGEATSCSISATDGESWTKLTTAGSATSRGITSQTIFALNCTETVTGEKMPQQTVTVSLIPVFQEK